MEATQHDRVLGDLWKKALDSAEQFGRKYQLLPDGRIVVRAEYEAEARATAETRKRVLERAALWNALPAWRKWLVHIGLMRHPTV